MEVVLRLREAQKLVEQGWCQEAPARTFYDRPCRPSDSIAQAWCGTGAAEAVTHDVDGFGEVIDALTKSLADLWEIHPHDQFKPWHKVEALNAWNDETGRSKNEVLRLYSRAIEMCSERLNNRDGMAVC